MIYFSFVSYWQMPMVFRRSIFAMVIDEKIIADDNRHSENFARARFFGRLFVTLAFTFLLLCFIMTINLSTAIEKLILDSFNISEMKVERLSYKIVYYFIRKDYFKNT